MTRTTPHQKSSKPFSLGANFLFRPNFISFSLYFDKNCINHILYYLMDNKEAIAFLSSHTSIREATEAIMNTFEIPEGESHSIRRKFGQLKLDRETFRKKNDLHTWEVIHFLSFQAIHPHKKRISEKNPNSHKIPESPLIN